LAQHIEKSNVIAYLKANLPRYMIPHAVYKLDEIPLTPGGKFDRQGLLQRYRNERELKKKGK